MTFTGLVDEIGQGTAEKDMLNESVLPTDGEEGVEREIIVTGETTLMTELEGAARTLLTLGPVAEGMAIPESPQADLKASRPPRLVPTLPRITIQKLTCLCRQQNDLLRLHQMRQRKRQSA